VLVALKSVLLLEVTRHVVVGPQAEAEGAHQEVDFVGNGSLAGFDVAGVVVLVALGAQYTLRVVVGPETSLTVQSLNAPNADELKEGLLTVELDLKMLLMPARWR